MPTPHIESNTEDIAKIVLMPGDPKRAEYIAKNFLEDYKLVNQVRGMTAYTGYYKNKKITVFPSGMGNPSMGIYSYELFKEYNVNTIIRIGTIGAYAEELNLGDVVLADTSISTSSFAEVQNGYKEKEITANLELNETIDKTAKEQNITVKRGRVFCSDVFYQENCAYIEEREKYQVLGVEMESFALYHIAKVLGKCASTILTVSNSFCSTLELTPKERETNLNNMIKLALESSLKL